ncbi:TetR/AcrR family transcriptional regulator [Parahaliea maris]|uniref:TetR/AcrR family transcriptional regulator n=1 Tax=Parahaliea maris TaxID=2716870 RepID=A0A5C8ZVS5_9GAMM|nr:TetR/AcrR family transcriptional regulator [Parahaliea maris]TXS91864.1 TetR/AcrR family transcriptional regulator [Parahaliea maris]
MVSKATVKRLSSQTQQYAREPKQNRSKASLERLLSSASEILAERGYNEFTLQEASKRAKVSIGSIYNRFSGKDDLIREVHARELGVMEVETAVLINELRRKELQLRQLVPAITKEFGMLLKRHSKILRPLMGIASVDEVVAKRGKMHFAQNVGDFERLLLERKSEIRQENPERAVSICFQIIYASLSRHLGLGTEPEIIGEGDWDTLLDDLSRVSLHFLLGHPDQLKAEPSATG